MVEAGDCGDRVARRGHSLFWLADHEEEEEVDDEVVHGYEPTCPRSEDWERNGVVLLEGSVRGHDLDHVSEPSLYFWCCGGRKEAEIS